MLEVVNIFFKPLKQPNISSFFSKGFLFSLAILTSLEFSIANASANINKSQDKNLLVERNEYLFKKEDYILGPGDVLYIEIKNIGELSGIFEIGPTGELYLPRLRETLAEGYSVDELRNKLIKKYELYLKEPEIFIRPVSYRPIRVYVGGEVSRPGFYTLSGIINAKKNISSNLSKINSLGSNLSSNFSGNNSSDANVFPTVFDAVQASQGVTAYSDLSRINVIRKISKGNGGGKKQTELNFLSLLLEGNESQNIRLFDDDVIQVKKSAKVLRDQLITASKTNLTPDKLVVFVSGRVKKPGSVTLPQGSSLNQALIASNGPKIIRGKVEFVRFSRGGLSQRKIFNYSPEKPIASEENPILMSGDIIRVQDNLLSTTSTVLGELTSPFIGIYSIYSFFNGVF